MAAVYCLKIDDTVRQGRMGAIKPHVDEVGREVAEVILCETFP